MILTLKIGILALEMKKLKNNHYFKKFYNTLKHKLL